MHVCRKNPNVRSSNNPKILKSIQSVRLKYTSHKGGDVDTKKWPILAQILIGLGVISGLMNIAGGLWQKNILMIIAGMVGLVVYWNLYKFKEWALIGVNILLSLSILLALVNLGKMPTLVLLFGIGYPALLLIYFNSTKIKELLR